MAQTGLRDRIDAVDEQLTALFAERMAIAAEIGRYKRRHGLPVLDAARETQKLEAAAAGVPDELKASVRALDISSTLFSIISAVHPRQKGQTPPPFSY